MGKPSQDSVETSWRRVPTRHGAFWRSLDESGAAGLADGFAHGRLAAALGFEPERRDFLRLMGASLALAGVGACSREPPEEVVPHVAQAPATGATEPSFFATATTLGGYAQGVLVERNMGRPTKVEGNPLHPASLGSTDVFAQAAVLDLWDPDRSRVVIHGSQPATWEQFTTALRARMAGLAGRQGQGLRILTETLTSPTAAAQIAALLARYPAALWHQYDPINDDNLYDGTRLAFGEALEVRYRFDKAHTIVSLDADFLGSGHARVRSARDFARGREAGARSPNRLYALTSCPSITSAVADHVLALRARDIGQAVRQLAQVLGAPLPAGAAGTGDTAGIHEQWLAACARDLAANRGASLVIAGTAQPPWVHAVAHRLNHVLGNDGVTLSYSEPVVASAANQTASLRALVEDMAAGRVDTLLVIGGNPVYCAPADLPFGDSLRHVALSARLGLHEDETSARCGWHLPAAHLFEAWSDARAYDGSVTILQPVIAPLYAGKSAHELLALLDGATHHSGYDIVREHWRGVFGADFEQRWNSALRDGLVANSALPTKRVALRRDFPAQPPALPDAPLELVFTPDPGVWDGRFANNAWLQELPRPLTKLSWDNAVLVPPQLARELALDNGDVLELAVAGRTLEAPAWIMPGHAPGAVSVSLGAGRTRAGRVGSGHGFDAYALRLSGAPWFAPGLRLRKTGARYPLATTQQHHTMEGRDLVRVATRRAYEQDKQAAVPAPHAPRPEGTLYPPFNSDGYAWAMTVNLGTCIGCNVCTIACQAENNIPVVGKQEVARGREMHWIRVDRYYDGTPEAPRTHFQPVPCMQCEHAPCELVCPVEASVHDSEGLNVQVYNRCVGTRFCSNNCPYKVRRFNFLQYADQHTESLKAQRNPEVTVRMRGVMEKCSYCIQRIANARIEADKENRRIRDGEVITACQAACPTQAITFGDLNEPASRVNVEKASPLNYALLEELNTRPRTTYLAKLVNPNPDVTEG